jgi:hypothetical protein
MQVPGGHVSISIGFSFGEELIAQKTIINRASGRINRDSRELR